MLKWLKAEVQYIIKQDPTATSFWMVLFLYPSIHARISHKLSKFFYEKNWQFISRLISQHSRRKTGIEIHPGATIGKFCFMDHGMGIVIGQTAIIGDYVTIFHGVTLGANRNTSAKRHPTIENHVLIGAGAKIIGAITVGRYAKIGANTVVSKDVSAYAVVVGAKQTVLNKEKNIEYMI
ncbi:hypothetical protein AwErysi_05880 [Erysipelotrichaceae bacterium]|nr:hypothetical protein AwErysi_05880 [Erysipelotrichaceae bacterium]